MKRIHILTKNNLLAGALVLSALLLTGCGFISGDIKIDEGVVIAPKLKLRSTTAPAALELAEVKRGDRLDIGAPHARRERQLPVRGGSAAHHGRVQRRRRALHVAGDVQRGGARRHERQRRGGGLEEQ